MAGLLAISALLMTGLSATVVGCDRGDEPSQEETTEGDDEEETDETSGDEGTDAPSPYDQFADVEPIEPTDVGPEGPAIYFLSGLKGYTEPCGCTVDVLLGGIDRITAFVRDAEQLHPDALMIDAGDWLFEYDEIPEHLEPQERAKAEVLADAHERMGTRFSVPGNRDLALGLDYYRQMMDRAGMTPLGANVAFEGEDLEAAKTIDVGGDSLHFVGIADPETYGDVEGLDVDGEHEAIEAATSEVTDEMVILVYQGAALRAEQLVEEVDGVDFAIVGHDPHLEEDARPFGSTRLLEAYDQGRYVGRLKWYGLEHEGEFADGRAGIRRERDGIDDQIEGVRRDLRRLEIRTEGEETPMAERLENRLEDLEERRRTLMRAGIEIPDDRPSFLYEPIAMEPGYRLDEVMERRREEYNESLADLMAKIDRDPLPVDDGEPFFVGQNECRDCHAQAHDFWENTSHASAVETLEVRNKQYDQNCIGCHVDGWEEPGGSVLGSIEYEAEIGGRTFTKDLHEVGCESCHGPGSNHLLDPLDGDGNPQHINRKPGPQQCTQCHVPDHSPTFDFDVYVDRITGEGHEYSGGE